MTTAPGDWIHMVGIAGAGMSGIARVLREQGIKVSGSDLQSNDVTKKLQELGVELYQGHSSSNLKEGVDLLVVSSAIAEDNEEVVAARKRNIPVIKRGQMLASLANRSKGMAVAGAHGKTTTTSMLYTVVEACGLDPTFIVGGEMQGTELNARLGQTDYFVLEADESDASFLELTPYIAIVTNIENDHLDYYKSEERIRNAFAQFLNQVDKTGFALLCGEDQSIQKIKDQLSCRYMLYGEDPGFEYCLKNWRSQGMGSIFEVYGYGKYVGEIQLSVPGKHNALNALATLAAALEMGLDFNKVKEALRAFKGAKRRFQVLGIRQGVMLVDDYAHHPTEIKATIEACRQLAYNRVIVIFQPHRYTRTSLLAKQFGESFRGADLTVVTDIYSAGERSIPGVSGELIAKAASEAGCNVVYIPTLDETQSFILERLQENDLLITMGAGDIWKIGLSIFAQLA